MNLKIELRVVVSTAQSYEEAMGALVRVLSLLNKENLQLDSFNVAMLNEAVATKSAEAHDEMLAVRQSAVMTALLKWGRSREWTQRELAKKLEIHVSYFSGMKNGKVPLTVELTRRVISGLQKLDDETATPIIEAFEEVQALLLAQRVAD